MHRYEYESSEVKTGSMRAGEGQLCSPLSTLVGGEGGGDDFERASSPVNQVSAPEIGSAKNPPAREPGR